MPNETSAEKASASPAWLPLGFVMGALLLLLVIPLIIQRAVNVARHRVDVSRDARALLSEFEAKFAQEVVMAAGQAPGDRTIDAKRAAAIAAEGATQRALDSVTAPLDGGATQQLGSLRTAERRWRALTSSGMLPLSDQTQRERLGVGQKLIDAAESLHRYLLDVSDRGRNEVRRLGTISLISSVALATIALSAMMIVVSLDRRVRRYARQLERSMELRATLIRGVGHDVKNPLGAASGYAELLEEGGAGPLNQRQHEMVTRFKHLIGTALQTVAELVDLARVDAGEYTIARRQTNLVSTVREIVEDHRARAMQSSVALNFTSSIDSLWLNTDQARVRHVVENLLSNALKYTPADGRVAVAVAIESDEQSRSRVTISVRDTGPGVPPDLRDRIFDPFFRAPSSEQRVSGSGLGLAISHRIAKLLGGTVTVTDAPGGGAEFVFSLPIEVTP